MTLHVQSLGAQVPPHRWLFRALQLTVGPGQIWALIGPNGSGKSILLQCLAGLRQATEGTIMLDDRPLASIPVRERATRIAYLPQLTPLYHDLDAHQLVMLGRVPHRSRWRGPRTEDQRHVDRALERVHASSLARRRISTLSGGERQRIMIARLLATEARLLLLDEPTTALDIGHALGLLALCRDLAREGTSIVLAMHELDLARRHSDQAICLGVGPDGIHQHGSTSQVLNAQTLGRVFGVEVREHGDELTFFRRL